MNFERGATPHQLTAGSVYLHGAQFSPDGKNITLVAGSSGFLTRTYLIPNQRTAPIVFDGQGGADDYLITRDYAC
jgi:hypothetical protein